MCERRLVRVRVRYDRRNPRSYFHPYYNILPTVRIAAARSVMLRND